MFSKIRSLIFKLDPELAHSLAIKALKFNYFPTKKLSKNKFFEYFHELPKWFTNLWVLVVASIFGIKGTQIFRNGKK